jgi:hypothetical protein
MPQITRPAGANKVKLVSPPGENRIRVGTAAAAISSGQGCRMTSAGYAPAASGSMDIDAIALMDYRSGEEGCDFLVTGEMDGYVTTGAAIGDPIFPSQSVAGGLQTESVASPAAPAAPLQRIGKIVTATRISFNLA